MAAKRIINVQSGNAMKMNAKGSPNVYHLFASRMDTFLCHADYVLLFASRSPPDYKKLLSLIRIKQ